MKNREKQIYKVTIVGSIVNVVLLAFKFIAGIFGNSSAMIADAIHSLSDFITDIIVVLFINISTKPKDNKHEYGHGKYETIATLMIGVILLFVGFGLAYNGTKDIISIFNGENITPPSYIALIAALASIILKEWLYHYTLKNGKQLNSQAVIANAWHHRSDALSSIGTTIGIGGALIMGNKWVILDPLAAVIVCFFIVKAAFGLIIPSINELVEKSLPHEIEKEIIETVSSINGVVKPHDLHTRRIGNICAIEMHILVDGEMTLKKAHDIASLAEEKLREKFGNETHIIIHPEPIEEEEMKS